MSVVALLLGCSPARAPAPAPAAPSAPAPVPAPAPAPVPPAPTPTAGIVSAAVSFPGQAGAISAYEARPAAGGPLPALIVIHENRGLTEHIKDVTRRFANQGYVVLGVDLLSRVGGREKFATDDEAVAAIGVLSSEGVVQDFQAAFDYLKSRPYVKADRIGVIGYCWGGGNSLLMATRVMGLRTAVVYYGPNPTNLDDVANISGPMLGIYGAEDTRITVNVPRLAEAMQKHNKSFEYKVYPGAAHAFFNDTGARYNAEAAVPDKDNSDRCAEDGIDNVSGS
ncbi:MAG: dienelactone hydrolase [Dehalococcoidia bacterium]|nr:dienelactone hydrolase [Dehalococcoidia bacterium]